MGKRKGNRENPKTLITGEENVGDERSILDQQDEVGEDEVEEGQGSKFFACYLLTSLCPRFKGHTYIGFTVNPRRRIRQHNGEIRSGAWRTKKKRPWEMVLCIHGFPTNVAALQFEWAWQHPVESLAVRKAAVTFKSLSGIANKIKLAYTMLTLPAWNSLNLTVNLFSTKYKAFTAGCPTLPLQMRTRICSMDDLPCYTENNHNSRENDEWDGDEELSTIGGQESSIGAAKNCRFPNDQGTKEINQIEETHYECSSCLTGQKRNSSPSRTSSSSITTSSYDMCDKIVSGIEDGYNSRFVEEELVDNHSLEKQSTTALVTEKDPMLLKSSRVNNEVEVIDVFTPSPCYKTSSGRKKRRPNVCPEIIDLTVSPIWL